MIWNRGDSESIPCFQIRPELRFIAEASDGLEAIQKAAELKSDLILLDVGLPDWTYRGRSTNSEIRPNAKNNLRES